MSRGFTPPRNTPDKDMVMTPDHLALDIYEHFNPSGVMLDPCRGKGSFYKLMPSGSFWCELFEGRDFMSFDAKVDWIVSNPPWSKIRSFINKGMEVSDNIVYLTTINHYTTKARLRDIYSKGFGIKEFYCVQTPEKPWPQLGFQLAAVHVQRGYTGDIKMSWSYL